MGSTIMVDSAGSCQPCCPIITTRRAKRALTCSQVVGESAGFGIISSPSPHSDLWLYLLIKRHATPAPQHTKGKLSLQRHERPLFMGAESCEKSESFVATFGRKLWSITLFLHARYGAMKVLCTGLVEFGGVLVENSKGTHS